MLGTLALDEDGEVAENPPSPASGNTKKLLLRVVAVGRSDGQGLVGKEFLVDSEKDWIVGKVVSSDPSFGSVPLEYKYVSSRHARISVKDSVSLEIREFPNVTNGTRVKVEGNWISITANEPRLVYAGMHIKVADVEIAVLMSPQEEEKPAPQGTPVLQSSGFGATIMPGSDEEEQEIVFQKPLAVKSVTGVVGVAAAAATAQRVVEEEEPTLRGDEEGPTVRIGGEEEPLTVVGAGANDDEGEPTEGGEDEEAKEAMDPTQAGEVLDGEKKASDPLLEPTQPGDAFVAPDASFRFDKTLPVTEKTIVLDKDEEEEEEVDDNGPTLMMGGAKEPPTQAWFEEEMAVSGPPPVTLGTATQTPIPGLPGAGAAAAQNLDVEDDDVDLFDLDGNASPPRIDADALVTASQRIMGPEGDMEEEEEKPVDKKEVMVALPGRVLDGSEQDDTQGRMVQFSLPVREESNLEKLTKEALQDKLRAWGLNINGSKAELLQRVKQYRKAEEEKVTEKDDVDTIKSSRAPDTLNVVELKAELKKLSLPVSGNKADLVARLKAAQNGQPESSPKQPFDAVPAPRGPVDSLDSVVSAVKSVPSRAPRGGNRNSLELPSAEAKKSDDLDIEEEITPAKPVKRQPVAVKTVTTEPKKKSPSGAAKRPSFDNDAALLKSKQKSVSPKNNDDLDIEEEDAVAPLKKKSPSLKKKAEDENDLEEEKKLLSKKKSPSAAPPPALKKKKVEDLELEEEPEEEEKEDEKKKDAKKKMPKKVTPKKSNIVLSDVELEEEVELASARKSKTPLKKVTPDAKKKSPKPRQGDDLEMEEEDKTPAPPKRSKKVSKVPVSKVAAEPSAEVKKAGAAFWYWASDKTGPKSHWTPYDAATTERLERDRTAGKAKSMLENGRWVHLDDMVQRVKGDASKRRPVLRTERALIGDELKRDSDEKLAVEKEDEEEEEQEERPSAAKRGKKKEPVAAKPSEAKKQKTAEKEQEQEQKSEEKKPAPKMEEKKLEKKKSSSIMVKKRGREEEDEEQKVDKVGKEDVQKKVAAIEKLERVVVASTGIKDEKQLKEIAKLASFGAEMTEDGSKCTHLVTAGKVMRTVKMLAAINAGCANVVTFDWVKECLRTGQLAPTTKWILKDAEMEKKFQFTLEESLAKARESKLFAGMTFYCTESTAPPPDQLKEIIESGGGSVKTALPAKSSLDAKLIVISCEKDKAACDKLKGRFSKIHVPELVLSGVLQQQIDLNKHLMN